MTTHHRRGILSQVFPAGSTRSEHPAFDLVVGDLIDNRTKAELDNPTDRGRKRFSLLDYALNLSPALRDTITRDVAQNVSAFEPRLQRSFLGFKSDPHDSSLREGSAQPKADYLLQPPKAPQE